MRRRRFIELLAVRWGFAAMVAMAIAVGAVAAATVTPPADLPPVALRAVGVYRVEVGAAVFFGLYLATMALSEDNLVVRDLLMELASEIEDLESRLENDDVR
jgi:hypothetical protein